MKNTLLLSFILMAFSSIAFSHSYHYEVQVTNKLISKDEKLAALKMTWLYDHDVSKAMLDDQKDLKKLENKLISDLDLLGYFTQVKLNGKALPFDRAKNVRLIKSKDLLELSFLLPLSIPIQIDAKNVLSLDHEDPSSIAILFYENASHIQLNGMLKKRCRIVIKEKDDFAEGEFPQVVKIGC